MRTTPRCFGLLPETLLILVVLFLADIGVVGRALVGVGVGIGVGVRIRLVAVGGRGIGRVRSGRAVGRFAAATTVRHRREREGGGKRCQSFHCFIPPAEISLLPSSRERPPRHRPKPERARSMYAALRKKR